MDALIKIEHRLQKIDVTELAQYTNKIKDIGTLNKMMAPIYMRDFIIAFDVTNNLLSMAIKSDLEASTVLDTARSIAYLDKAGEFLKEKGIKDSSEARKQYIELDEDVIKAYITAPS